MLKYRFHAAASQEVALHSTETWCVGEYYSQSPNPIYVRKPVRTGITQQCAGLMLQGYSLWFSLVNCLFDPVSYDSLCPSFCSSHTGLLAVPPMCQACVKRSSTSFSSYIPSARMSFVQKPFTSFRSLLR